MPQSKARTNHNPIDLQSPTVLVLWARRPLLGGGWGPWMIRNDTFRVDAYGSLAKALNEVELQMNEWQTHYEATTEFRIQGHVGSDRTPPKD